MNVNMFEIGGNLENVSQQIVIIMGVITSGRDLVLLWV